MKGRLWLLIGGLTLAFTGLALVLGQRSFNLDPVRDHAVTRTNPWGTKALAELCRASGLKVAVIKRPLTSLGPAERVLCFFDPSRPPDNDDLRAMVDWVEAGGTLLLGIHANVEHNLLSFNPLGAGADELLLAAVGLAAEAKGPAETVLRPVSDRPELREVATVAVPGPYRLRPVSREELARRRRQVPGELPPHALRSLVTVRWEPLLSDQGGWVAARARHGQGQMIALAEVELLANKHLAAADNVVLAANLLFTPGASTVHFYERLHLSTGGRSEEAAELDPSRGYWALAAALLALGLYLMGVGRRFGAAVPLAVRPRRSSLEFVEALADLYRRAEARGAVCEVLHHSFRQRLALLAGVPADLPAEELAAAAARRRPEVSEAQLAGLLKRLQAGTQTPPDEEHLLQLGRLVAAYEEALRHGR